MEQLQKQITSLEERIKILEARPVYIPQYIPQYIPTQPYSYFQNPTWVNDRTTGTGVPPITYC